MKKSRASSTALHADDSDCRATGRTRTARRRPPVPRPNMLDDNDVTLRPPWSNSPDLITNPNAPQGRIHRFTMKSEDSKIYKGISRDKPGEVVPYERPVAIYIPAQYVRRHAGAVHRRAGRIQPEVPLQRADGAR